MIARVEVPGTTLLGLSLVGQVDVEGRDVLFTLTDPGGAVSVEVRMTLLEAATLRGALADQLTILVTRAKASRRE